MAYPTMDLYVDGLKVAVGSADVDELDQWSDADALWSRGLMTERVND